MSDVNQKLLEALKWALEYIDNIPEDVVLPAMPGFDRNYVNGLLEEVEKGQQTKPVAQPFVWWSDASREVWMALEAGRELKHDERDAYLSSVEISGAIPLYTKQPVQTVARDVLSEDLPDAVIEATAEAIGDAYDCMRDI